MNDMIRRCDAIQAIKDLPNCPNGYSDTYDKETIINVLNDIPTADVALVVHAKWVKSSDDGLLECSNCGAYVFEYNNILPNYYCRGCGAKMDKVEDV